MSLASADAAVDSVDAAQTVPSAESVSELASSVSRLLHVFNRARAHMLDKARHDVEWSAQVAITTLVVHGPMRSGALAEHLQADPSTVSRQVAGLVRDGLVERQADPDDGRASLLVATPRGRAVHESHLTRRDDHFRAMLAGWSEADVAELAHLVARFTEDFDTYKNTLSNTLSNTLADDGWTASATRKEQA